MSGQECSVHSVQTASICAISTVQDIAPMSNTFMNHLRFNTGNEAYQEAMMSFVVSALR